MCVHNPALLWHRDYICYLQWFTSNQDKLFLGKVSLQGFTAGSENSTSVCSARFQFSKSRILSRSVPVTGIKYFACFPCGNSKRNHLTLQSLCFMAVPKSSGTASLYFLRMNAGPAASQGSLVFFKPPGKTCRSSLLLCLHFIASSCFCRLNPSGFLSCSWQNSH